MALGDLAIVESWLKSVNASDRTSLLALTAADVEIVGPRGVGRGRELLADWLVRAGFSSQGLRWFCGTDGRIVVEQDATWVRPNGEKSSTQVASAFVIREKQVARFQRFDSLNAALSAVGLGESDEVVVRS